MRNSVLSSISFCIYASAIFIALGSILKESQSGVNPAYRIELPISRSMPTCGLRREEDLTIIINKEGMIFISLCDKVKLHAVKDSLIKQFGAKIGQNQIGFFIDMNVWGADFSHCPYFFCKSINVNPKGIQLSVLEYSVKYLSSNQGKLAVNMYVDQNTTYDHIKNITDLLGHYKIFKYLLFIQ
jgi:biopolymer transport protein ExbD